MGWGWVGRRGEKTEVVVVFDVGKTHVKLVVVLPGGGGVLEVLLAENLPIDRAPYLHVDVEAIFSWLIDALLETSERFEILAIVPSAYGSTAALIDDDGLVLPMMDYEAEPPLDIQEAYAQIAPEFDEVCCPINPAGLTLARQLFWQSRKFPDQFERARWILPAAQYWAWRLTGVVASEVTSLGAQTQLWNPRTNQPSSLAMREGWSKKFPPLRKAFDSLGPPHQALASSQAPGSLPVLVGIHDSNANYLRYLAAGFESFTLISSGTWLITFEADLPLDRLDPRCDMVANIDLEGRPVACTRFMGGREFFDIAGEDGLKAEPSLDDLNAIIASGTMALPSFTDSGGPFPKTGNQGRISGPGPKSLGERAALASLYVALVTAVDLDLLDSSGDVIIDGSFAENRLFAGLLAALRPKQSVLASKAREGTALGASLLYGWPRSARLDLEPITAIKVVGLDGYAKSWRSKVGDR